VEDAGALDGILAGIEPEDDVEASAVHRRRLARTLSGRALAEAAARAREAA
jgi:CO/xanthine dehydrogenase FAD-binding subunit